MKKSSKGEVVLSACQTQAARLNKLEYRRLQRHVHLLHDDLESHLARLHRQEQGLRYHYTNVVRVIKPNAAYQRWKQAHAQEIAQDEAEELIKSIKRKQRSTLKIRQPSAPVQKTESISADLYRPLLLLVGQDNQKNNEEPLWTFSENFLRPTTSPGQKPPMSHVRRINPMVNMIDGTQMNSTQSISLQQSPLESPSFHSSSTMLTNSSRKYHQGKFIATHKAAEIDAFHRIALQNQTAYKSIDRAHLDQRKLMDKQFASQHRALRGSIRSAGIVC